MNSNFNLNENREREKHQHQHQHQHLKGRKRRAPSTLALTPPPPPSSSSSNRHAATALSATNVNTSTSTNSSKITNRSRNKMAASTSTSTTSTSPTTSTDPSSEMKLLASISGTSITSSSTYETKVLRDATSQNSVVPKLTGVGFPSDLYLLAPSFQSSNNNNDKNVNVKRTKLNNRHPDVSHMITVFQKIQSELDEIESNAIAKNNRHTKTSKTSKISKSALKQMEHHQTNKLRLKKQMLLSFFQSYTTDVQSEDLRFDVGHDRRMEQSRSAMLQDYSHLHSNNGNNYVSGNGNSGSGSNGGGLYIDEMGMMVRRNMKKGDSANAGHSGNTFQISTLGTKRLEDIKQNNILDHDTYDDDNDYDKELDLEMQKQETENHPSAEETEMDVDVDILLSKSKNASFGQHALSNQRKAREQLLRKKKAKKKMMLLKKQMVEQNGEEWVDPEELYRKRLERRERRRQRRYGCGVQMMMEVGTTETETVAALPLDSIFNENSGDGGRDNGSSCATAVRGHSLGNSANAAMTARRKNQKKRNKMKTKDKTKTVITPTKEVQKHTISTNGKKDIYEDNNGNENNTKSVEQLQSKEMSSVTSATGASTATTEILINETKPTTTDAKDDIIKTVSCPICNNDKIQVSEDYNNDIDLFLSKHMASCNGVITDSNNYKCNNSNNNTIGGTRRSRRKCATRSVINYTEVDERDYDGENDDMVEDHFTNHDYKKDNGGNDDKTKSVSWNSDDSHAKRNNDKVSQNNTQAVQQQQIKGGDKNDNYVNDSDVGDEEDEGESDYDDKNDIEPSDNCDDENSDSFRASSEKSDYVRRKTIDDFDEEDYEDRVDEWIENGIQNMREMKEQDDNEAKPGAVTFPGGLEIPAWINDRLFTYQRTALRWMWELYRQNAGGIVGDEMGLGKTVQVCSYLGSLAASRKIRSVLIIVPATMLMHWLNELTIWAPGLRRILMHKSGEKRGSNPSDRNISRRLLQRLDKWLNRSRVERLYEPIDERDVLENDPSSFVGTGIAVLTTFESIRRYADIWVSYNWSYVVMDEGQKIRNPDADVTIACKRLRTTNRLLLSGTPIQNDLKELWSLFDFVFPGRLGVLPTFLNEFADPIRRGGYSNASSMQVQLAYRCALVLRDLINPYLLRRRKKDMKEVSRMPGKTEQVLFCKLCSRQRRMYEAYLESDEVQHILRNRGTTQSFKPIITLRKICNHPYLLVDSAEAYDSFLKNGQINSRTMDDYSSGEDSLVDDDIFDEDSLVESSGKLEVLAKILPLWKDQGHRVLIFSQWKKTLDIIQHFTKSKGWNFGRMDGNTNVAARQKLVDKFNSDDALFGMLLTTKTGGVGLNLIGANRVVLFDPDWNPQSDAQARERAWRFGQEKQVTVYRLITAGTIEEKIYQRQIFKTAITNQILQDPRQRRMFSQRDLRDLFTLKPEPNVAAGGDGVTETGELTKGRGVVNVDNIENDHDNESEMGCCDSQDNRDTLETVLKSRGLAGIFDHDIVEAPFAAKSLTQKEMEQQAKKVAARAAKKLAESLKESTSFEPTWTGTEGTNPQRFGGASGVARDMGVKMNRPSKMLSSLDEGFGGATSVGLHRTGTSGGVSSSSSLIAQLQQRKREISTLDRNIVPLQPDLDEQNVKLLIRMRTFLQDYTKSTGRGPSTATLKKELKEQKMEPAVFRSMVRSIASLDNGEWILKKLE